MTNEEEIFMQELGNDPEYVAWCDQRNQEAMEEMLSMDKNKYMVFVYGSLKRGFGIFWKVPSFLVLLKPFTITFECILYLVLFLL